MNKLESCQKAAEIHKKVRKDLHEFVKPGVKPTDICKLIESKVKNLSRKYGNRLIMESHFQLGFQK